MNKSVLFLTLMACLFIAGCKETRHEILGGIITQPISGPIDIGKEWIEIVPPKQLKVISNINYIVVKAKGLEQGPNMYRSLKFSDGSIGKIEVRLYDDKGQAVDFDYYSWVWADIPRLEIWEKGTNFEDGDLLRNIQSIHRFPHDTRFVKAQIRSDVQLHCDSIEWVGSSSNK
jgi:hypothetical protein